MKIVRFRNTAILQLGKITNSSKKELNLENKINKISLVLTKRPDLVRLIKLQNFESQFFEIFIVNLTYSIWVSKSYKIS